VDTQTLFQVKQDAFEGPIEVLLELIEKRKLFVNDVSLVTVTDDFISYIQATGMHPDMVANFLSVAATLILIKARSLLPNLELTTDEAASITDLERRIALYQVVSDISNVLMKEYGKQISYVGAPRQKGSVFAPDPTLVLEAFPGLISETAARMPVPEAKKVEARVFKTISITEVLSTLTDRIERALNGLSFNAVRVQSPDQDEKSQKVYTIVSFLGMLELVRRGLIEAHQTELFEDISLEKNHG
jgi:segregation and condensation protein A